MTLASPKGAPTPADRRDAPEHTALGDFFRERAVSRRELAAANPGDPRNLRSAEALDELAFAADRQIENRTYYACHLLRYHMHDGRFAWPDGQSGRAVWNFGFASATDGPEAHDAFLADLCDLATWDACRYIANHESNFDRRDATTIAQRYGMSAERVHSALDAARYHQLFLVGIPHTHDLTHDMRQALESLDGTWIQPRAAASRRDDERPTYVNNVGASTERHARQIVGQLVSIDPDALGAGVYPRVFPAGVPGQGA